MIPGGWDIDTTATVDIHLGAQPDSGHVSAQVIPMPAAFWAKWSNAETDENIMALAHLPYLGTEAYAFISLN